MKMALVGYRDGTKDEYTNVLNVGYHLESNKIIIERLGEPTIVYCRDVKCDNEDTVFIAKYDEISIVIVS